MSSYIFLAPLFRQSMYSTKIVFSVNVGVPRCSNTSVMYPIKHRRSLNTPKEQIVQLRTNANLPGEGQRYTATGIFNHRFEHRFIKTVLLDPRMQHNVPQLEVYVWSALTASMPHRHSRCSPHHKTSVFRYSNKETERAKHLKKHTTDIKTSTLTSK